MVHAWASQIVAGYQSDPKQKRPGMGVLRWCSGDQVSKAEDPITVISGSNYET